MWTNSHMPKPRTNTSDRNKSALLAAHHYTLRKQSTTDFITALQLITFLVLWSFVSCFEDLFVPAAMGHDTSFKYTFTVIVMHRRISGFKLKERCVKQMLEYGGGPCASVFIRPP